jgi:AraC-like DNA-binding protein
VEVELWQAFLQVTGGVNAIMLGAILLFSPRMNRTRARQKLGLALLAYGYLLFSFTAVDNFWVQLSEGVLLSDYVIVLAVAALFLDYISSSLGRGKISRLFYLPAPLFLVIALVMGGDFILGAAINWVVVVQVTYTCLTTWVYLRSRHTLASRTYHLRVLLVGLWILHAFQLSRMLFPEIGWLFDLVPLVGTALVLAFTALVLTDSRTLRALSQVVPSQPEHSVRTTDIDTYMRSEKPYLDSRLTLQQLADVVGLPPRQLSLLVQSTSESNFYQFVNKYRIEEAKRLLVDPREQRTSIEAIGLMAGFRARSTFYEAFRRQEGKTPAQYRKDLESAAS